MSYRNIEKNAYRFQGQDERSQIANDYSFSEKNTMGYDLARLEGAYNAKEDNQDRIYSQMREDAIDASDYDKVELIDQAIQKESDKRYDKEMADTSVSASISGRMNYYGAKPEQIQELEAKQVRLQDTDYVAKMQEVEAIEQEQIDTVNKEIQDIQYELEKIDGIWNNIPNFLGAMGSEFNNPYVLATLPLSFYTSTGRAAVGATAQQFLRSNAWYTMRREFGLAAAADTFVQMERYEYSHYKADPEAGIFAMTAGDVAMNVAINSFMAGSVAAGGSAILDYSSIKINPVKFKKSEDIASFKRTKEAGIDRAKLTQLLKDTTFDNEIDPMVVSEIKWYMDNSPSADINTHTATMTKGAMDIDSKGHVDLPDDDVTIAVQEAVAGDHIGIRDNSGNSFIGKVLSNTDKDVTIQWGDKEIKINKEDGQAIGEDLYSAKPDSKPDPVPEAQNINEVNTEKSTQKATPPEQQKVMDDYADNPEVMEANTEIDASMKEFEDILGIEPEVKETPVVRKNQTTETKPKETPAVKEEAAVEVQPSKADETPDAELINDPNFKAVEESVKNPPKKETTREGNEAFSLRMESLLTSDGEDAVNAAWYERMQGGVDTTDVGYETPQLTKTELKAIKAGKGTPEQLQQLREDLNTVERMNQEVPETITIQKDDLGNEIVWAKAGPELFGGSVAGIEEDENGNITIDPAKFIIGMVLGHTAKRLALNPKVQEGTLSALNKYALKLAKENPALFDLNPKLYAGETARGFKEAQTAGKTTGDTADKQEKFWIDDIGAKAKIIDWSEGRQYKLDQVIKHDELFNQYPELKNTKVKFRNLGGPKAQADMENNYIAISPRKIEDAADIESTILHEVQHMIQGIEGFAKGGSYKDFTQDDLFKEIYAKHKDLPYVKKLVEQVKNRELNHQEYTDKVLDIAETTEDGGLRGLAHELYTRLAGEQEARATQAALKHPGEDPYAALAKEEGDLKKPIVKMDNQGVAESTLLERKAQKNIDAGLPPKAKSIRHPDRKKDYMYDKESDTVFFQRAGGKWREMPNVELRNDIKYIDKNGIPAFIEKNKEPEIKIDKSEDIPDEYNSFNEKQKEFFKRAASKKEQLSKEANRHTKSKPPKPNKLYRGVEADGYEVKGGGAKEGYGLYTTVDKELASNYGKIIEMNPEEDLPKNPLVFTGMNEFEIYEQQMLFQTLNFRRLSDLDGLSLNEMLNFIDPTIDGVQIGNSTAMSSGTYWVKFPDIKEVRNTHNKSGDK